MRRLHAIEDVIKDGRTALASDAALGTWLDGEIASGKGADPSIILYTSGTTGAIEGRRALRDRLHQCGVRHRRIRQADRAGDEALAYLPLAWVGDHYLNYAQALVAAFCLACPESGGKARTADMK